MLYVYSRPYVYSFCQIFQALRLFPALRLLWTLEQFLSKKNIGTEFTHLFMPSLCQKIIVNCHNLGLPNGDLVRGESSILRKRHSCWHGRKFSLATAASHNAVKLFSKNFIAQQVERSDLNGQFKPVQLGKNISKGGFWFLYALKCAYELYEWSPKLKIVFEFPKYASS